MRLGVEAAIVDGTLLRGDVEIADGQIAGVGLAPGRSGTIAVPGFIDLQVNGFAGVDFLSAAPEDYRAAGDALLQTGVTSFQPTLITAPEEQLLEALRAVPAQDVGPRILGVHLEGPFLAPGRLGTHPADARRDPDVDLLERLLGVAPVTQVTLAPELPGADALIGRLVARGIVVSAGHTDATAEEAFAAFDAGVTTVTHIFNAMRPFRPRDPGVAAAALVREGVVVQMILDGHHLAEETARLVWSCARGRVALVTDAIAAAAVGRGTFRLGSIEIAVEDGAPTREDGTLAGTVLTMIDAVRNLHALGADLVEAVDAATAVPARVCRRPDLGVLTVGGVADVVVLDDRLEVADVLRGGESRVAA